MMQYLRLLHRGIRRTMISACLPTSVHGRQRLLWRSWSDGVSMRVTSWDIVRKQGLAIYRRIFKTEIQLKVLNS